MVSVWSLYVNTHVRLSPHVPLSSAHAVAEENSMTSSTIAALFTLPSHEAAGINEIEFLLIFFYVIIIFTS